jgi:hypothetical protein
MTEHSIFYYPYASFTDAQAPLLKAVALYFDKLYILDPEKASGGIVGAEDVAQDVALLDSEGLLERVAPEEILLKYEDLITDAVRDDLQDQTYEALCAGSGSGRAYWWTLALAKVPKEIREDPRFKPTDQAMQRMMGDTAQALAPQMRPYVESYVEVDIETYDETRRGATREIEYRYVDVPLPLGESIMINHALFGALLHTGATPLTDDRFHSQVLNLKMERARNIPALRQVLDERARRSKIDLVAASAITDTQLNLPALSPQLPLEAVLEYRQANKDALEEARDKMGWLARRTKGEPWSKGFWDDVEQEVIPDLAEKLEECEKAQKDWLESKRGRRVLGALGIGAAAAAVVVPLVMGATPLLPVAVATATLGIVKDVAIPGAEWVLDWRDGKKTPQENGLHYLLGPATAKKT